MTNQDRQLDEAMARYQRRREELGEFQRRMAQVSAKVAAPRQVVSVTVGSHGELRELTFPSPAYKNMTPSELASVIMNTIDQARAQALDQAADLLAPMLPAGVNPRELVRGKADLDAMMPEDPERIAVGGGDVG
ncbi:MAG: YbaB/EbfC family nucleoid-associated protein [Thermocrispum sp.]